MATMVQVMPDPHLTVTSCVYVRSAYTRLGQSECGDILETTEAQPRESKSQQEICDERQGFAQETRRT